MSQKICRKSNILHAQLTQKTYNMCPFLTSQMSLNKSADVTYKTHRHTTAKRKLFWGPFCMVFCSIEWHGCASATLCKCARFLNTPTHFLKSLLLSHTVTSFCFEKVALQDMGHKCFTERNYEEAFMILVIKSLPHCKNDYWITNTKYNFSICTYLII